MDRLIARIQDQLQKNVAMDRYLHVMGVKQVCFQLGEEYNLNLKKLCLASLLHDFAKFYTSQQLTDYCLVESIPIKSFENNHHGFLHARVAHHIAYHTYQIDDLDILNAILYHTTGRKNMSIYEEVLFVADYCEPNRPITDKIDIIQQASVSLEKAVLQVLSGKIQYVLKKQLGIIHPKSIEAYNWYIQKLVCTAVD